MSCHASDGGSIVFEAVVCDAAIGAEGVFPTPAVTSDEITCVGAVFDGVAVISGAATWMGAGLRQSAI